MNLHRIVAAALGLAFTASCGSDPVGPGGDGLRLSAESFEFGAVVVGYSTGREISATNDGTRATGTISVQLAGDHSADFRIESDNCSGRTLDIRASCTLVIVMRPTTAGTREAQLTVGAGVFEATAILRGSGADGGLVMHNSTYNFGDAGVSTTGPTHGFIVRNLGLVTSGPVTVELAGTGSASYSIVGGTCAGAQLPVSGACIVTVRFQPATSGTIAGLLTVSASPGGNATAILSGVGGTVGLMVAEPATHHFGTLRVGADFGIVLAFRNTGTTATGALSARIAGGDASDFNVTGGTCEGARLAPGQQCTVFVGFAPQTSGAKSAMLEVRDVFGTSASATLAGVGELVLLQFEPGYLEFGEIQFGTSKQLPVTVANQGDAPTDPLEVRVERCDYYYGCSPSPDFTLASTTCAGTPLAPAATCAVAVTFNPQDFGYRSAQVSVVDGGNTYTVSLVGFSVLTQLAVTPDQLTFPATQVGASSANQLVTVTNVGGQASGTLAVYLCSGYYCYSTTQFEVAPSDCSEAVLLPGHSCTIPVAFAPDAAGPHSAQLIVQGGGTTRYVTLAGEAVAGP